MYNFFPYTGDLIGLPTSKNHLNFKWNKQDCKILFSVAKQGKAVSIHIASDKRGIFKIRTASREFCNFVFDIFPWCKMIIAKIDIPVFEKIAFSCGFEKLLTIGNRSAYIKLRRQP